MPVHDDQKNREPSAPGASQGPESRYIARESFLKLPQASPNQAGKSKTDAGLYSAALDNHPFWRRWLARARSGRVIGLRGLLLLLTFLCGFIALSSGVELSEREGLPEAGVLTRLYYAVGLFVLAGIDLGMPSGEPSWARNLLWAVYFIAPAITAGAVIEGVLKAIEPQAWRLRRVRDHIVIAGGSRLALLYLSRLRQVDPLITVVLVDSNLSEAVADQAQNVYHAEIIQGEIASLTVLKRLRIEHAARVVLLSDNDFINLDAATRIIHLAPELAERIVVHVADLRFMRSMEHSLVAQRSTIFNAHQISAIHLVETQVLKHFDRTLPRDRVILAGFGRFGQSVLAELQARAGSGFDRCVIIDTQARRAATEFDEQVGFSEGYRRHVVDGDIRDMLLWQELEQSQQLSQCEPVVIVGSGDDGTNLRTAIWVKSKLPRALVIARSFRASLFAEEVSKESGFQMVSVADLLLQSMPEAWFSDQESN